jgi:hypothetical protein
MLSTSSGVVTSILSAAKPIFQTWFMGERPKKDRTKLQPEDKDEEYGGEKPFVK